MGTDADDGLRSLFSADPVTDRVERARVLDAVERELVGSQRPQIALSRYLLIGRIGVGGMGVVYSAYDPELDRKVAIKLLSTRTLGSEEDGERRARLLREAQAMAQLSHPSVIAVHDVGTYDEETLEAEPSADRRLDDHGVFVVMELVDGPTLAEWMGERRRGWREVTSVLIAAGRGLQAAHDAGLVHRDFKPGNVLVGRDGRVRVLDFGLARTVREAQEVSDREVDATPVAPGPSSPGSDGLPSTRQLAALDLPLTGRGTVLGTPAYMAPEQHYGQAADMRSDQFGFCVTLFEALYGRRPFVASDLDKLAAAKRNGAIVEPSNQRPMPGWLKRATRRGLSPDPDRRWPSMTALLDELARDRRRRWWVAGSIVAAGLVGGQAIAGHLGQRAVCEDTDSELAAVWNEPRSQAIERAFVGTNAPFAAQSWATARTWLDQYADEWSAMRLETCQATHVHHRQSPDLMDRRIACLDERLAELDGLLGVLDAVEASVVRKAIDAVATLSPVEPCSQAQVLAEGMAQPGAEQASEVDRLKRELARARALENAGQYPQARVLVQPLVARAKAVGYPPVVALALYHLGRIDMRQGNQATAEARLSEAAWAAAAVGYDDVAFRAQADLVYLKGCLQSQTAVAEVWSGHARAILERSELPEVHLGRLLSSQVCAAEAAGDYARAIDLGTQAVELNERLLGPNHPALAVALTNLGSAEHAADQRERSMQHMMRALEITEATRGPDHPAVGYAVQNIGVHLGQRGQPKEALERLDLGLAVLERALGPDHREVALALVNRGAGLRQLGRLRPAIADYQRAIAIYERALGPNDPAIAQTWGNLGIAYQNVGDLEASIAAHRRGIAIYDEAPDPDHPVVAFALIGLAYALVDAGQLEEAVDLAERAVEIRQNPEVPMGLRGDSLVLLAHALWTSKTGHKRALGLAREAQQLFRAAGPSWTSELEATIRWIAEREPNEKR